MLDSEQAQDREVLVRLRARSLGRVDDEQEEVDPRRPGDHVADEALVTGNVHDREPAAVRQLERRVAEVDRDPPLLLLGQPVGVLARERPDEPGLAVVDVPRRAEYERRRASPPGCRDGGGDLVHLRVGERAAVEQQPAVAHDADDRRRHRLAAARPSSSSSAQAKLVDLGERQRAASDARDRLLDGRRRCGRRAARRAPERRRPVP